MSYYINLSFLSNKFDNMRKANGKKLLSDEARRILSLCEGRRITNEDIAREETGRPFFPNSENKGHDTDFSISHSGTLAAVSLVRGKNLRTGCDVEFVRQRVKAPQIAEEFFTVQEKDYIESGGGFDMTRFYHIWTLKECFLKLKGGSVFDMPKAPSFISYYGQCKWQFNSCAACVSPVFFNLYELSGNVGERYILAAAVEGTEKQPEIRWFSQDFLDCKSIAKIKAAISPAETVSPKI